MLLAVDVGNSNIVAGVWDGNTLIKSWRIHTVAKKTEDEYATIFRSLFFDAGLDPKKLDSACIASVVPCLTGSMSTMIEHVCSRNPLVLGPDLYDRLPIGVVNPYEIGADLVADAVAAYHRCRGACLVIDFGTALTFSAIDSRGTMQGVAIAPGLGTAINSLSRDTAQLPFVQLTPPPAPYGKNTVHAIQAGVVYGFTGLVEHMIGRIEKEMGERLQVIATGGLCTVVAPLTSLFTYVDEDLTLRGLMLIATQY